MSLDHLAVLVCVGWRLLIRCWSSANLAHHFSVKMVHRKLDEFADRYCPVVQQFGLSYHWSLDQVEFATDIVFAKQADLQAIYDRLTRAAIHTVKPDNIATFLGR